MALFLDASAIVKVYVREKGSRDIRFIVADPHPWGDLFISELSLVEVRSALAKKCRKERLSARRLRRATRHFMHGVEHAYDVVPLSQEIVERASEIVARYWQRSISSGDALQISSAEWVARKLQLRVYHLVSSDQGFLKVANRIGFNTFDPEKEDMEDLAYEQIEFTDF